jgi:hypothetical protein
MLVVPGILRLVRYHMIVENLLKVEILHVNSSTFGSSRLASCNQQYGLRHKVEYTSLEILMHVHKNNRNQLHTYIYQCNRKGNHQHKLSNQVQSQSV